MNAGKPWRKSSVSHDNSQGKGIVRVCWHLTFLARVSVICDNSVQQNAFLYSFFICFKLFSLFMLLKFLIPHVKFNSSNLI